MGWVESNIRATQRMRYADAVRMQGFAFIELRTPPRDLPLGDRPRLLKYPDGPIDDADRLHVLPPAELFGEDRHPLTAEILSGTHEPVSLSLADLAWLRGERDPGTEHGDGGTGDR